MACEGRRLAALRDGFGRALEGATGACGFEARVCAAPAPGLPAALNGPHAPLRRAQEFKACYAHVPEAYHATMFDVYCQARQRRCARGATDTR